MVKNLTSFLVSTKKRMNFVTFFAFFKELASICHDSHINNSIDYDFHGILEVMKRVEYKYASRHLKIKGYQQIQLEFLQGNKLVQGLPRLNFQVPAEGLEQVILLHTVLFSGCDDVSTQSTQLFLK